MHSFKYCMDVLDIGSYTFRQQSQLGIRLKVYLLVNQFREEFIMKTIHEHLSSSN